MPLPEIVRVKLSSEDAGSMNLTAVVAQEMPLRELVELMLGVTGKDPERVHQILLRGTLVKGGSRYRWTGWDAAAAELTALLAEFPESDASRAFSAERVIHAVIHGPSHRIPLTREAASARRFLRRRSFWDTLYELATGGAPRYVEYSYAQRADCFRLELSMAELELLRRAAGELNYSGLEAQVRQVAITHIDFYVAREG